MIKLRVVRYPAHSCTTPRADAEKRAAAAPVRRCARVKQRRETGKHAARLMPSCIYCMMLVQQIIEDNNNAPCGEWG